MGYRMQVAEGELQETVENFPRRLIQPGGLTDQIVDAMIICYQQIVSDTTYIFFHPQHKTGFAPVCADGTAGCLLSFISGSGT